MKKIFELIANDLLVTLALLIVLGGAFILPFTHASSTAQVNLGLSVVNPGEEPPAEEPPNQSGGGSGAITPNVPNQPQPDEPIPTPEPSPTFELQEYTPRIFRRERTNRVYFYGKNFPEGLQVRALGTTSNYIGDIANRPRTVKTAFGESERLEYIFPANVLPIGHAILQLYLDNTPVTDALAIWTVSQRDSVEPEIIAVEYPRNLEMLSGSQTRIQIKYKNNSSVVINELFQPLLLGTAQPFDRNSNFFDSSWAYSNRVERLPSTILNANDEIVVNVPLRAPTVRKQTRYKESFALVSEGLAWIKGSTVTVNITVKPSGTINPPVRNQPTTANPRPKSTIQRIIERIVPPALTAPKQPDAIKSPYNTPKVVLEQPKPSIITTIKNFFNRLFQ